jgi:hypothetical protein
MFCSWRDVNHPFPSSAKVKETVEVYFDRPSMPSRPVVGRNLRYLLFNPAIGCFLSAPFPIDYSLPSKFRCHYVSLTASLNKVERSKTGQ